MAERRTSARDELVGITDRLVGALRPMRFAGPITHVYNPLEYARAPWNRYVEKFARARHEVVFLGMNPGPFGMAQTGVPFGEVSAVRDWMGILEPVGKPTRENPKRPVQGFACSRSEVSGRRFWGWAQSRFGLPERFFARAFVLNYCPLVFMESTGRNFTPDKLPALERDKLFAACDRALREAIAALGPRCVVGIGAFAESRIKGALEGSALEGITVGRILHPSPANPAANRDWQGTIEKELAALGVGWGDALRLAGGLPSFCGESP